MGIFHRFVSAKAQGGDATLASKDEWNNSHKLELDGVLPGHRVGTVEDRWYSAGIGASLLTTGAPSANRLRAVPFIPAKDMTLDRIAFAVTTLLAGNGIAGIYNDDGNLYPSTKVVDGGSISTATATVKATNIAVPVLGGEVYWLAYVSSAAATVRCFTLASLLTILGASNALAQFAVGWDVAYTFAAPLPASFPAGAVVIVGTPLAAVFVRGT